MKADTKEIAAAEQCPPLESGCGDPTVPPQESDTVPPQPEKASSGISDDSKAALATAMADEVFADQEKRVVLCLQKWPSNMDIHSNK